MWEAAAARAVICRVRPQAAVEATRATLQEISVGARQTLALDAVACCAGAITGFTHPIWALIETTANQSIGWGRKRHIKTTIMSVILSSCSLWAVWPTAPPVEKKFIASFGAADAVVTVVYTRFTVWWTILTQLSSRASKGARWTLQHTRTLLVQEISCGTNERLISCAMHKEYSKGGKCLHLWNKKHNLALVGRSRSYRMHHMSDIGYFFL